MTKINSGNLKLWQKELMLLFDLENDQTTINIHGREFDRDTLINNFETLKKSWPFHLKLYQNKPLLEFLEKGETYFFKSPDSWEIFDDISFLVWVEPFFVAKYSDFMYRCATTKGFQSLHKLKTMCQSKFPMPFTFQDDCYEKTYSHFHHLIEKGKRKYKNPVKRVARKKKALLKGLDEYLSIHYLSAFQVFPSQFDGLKSQYGHFAHSILYAALYKGEFMTQFDKESLRTLNLCAKISWKLIQNQSAKGIQKDLKKVIEAKEMSNLEAMVIGVMLYILLFFTLYVLMYLA